MLRFLELGDDVDLRCAYWASNSRRCTMFTTPPHERGAMLVSLVLTENFVDLVLLGDGRDGQLQSGNSSLLSKRFGPPCRIGCDDLRRSRGSRPARRDRR